MPDKSERFTDSSRVALSVAEQTAKQLSHATVGLEHILVGLIQAHGVSGDVFNGLALNHREVLPWFQHSYFAMPVRPDGKIGLAEPMKRLLEGAVDEARRTSHIQITTGHMLLAFIRQKGDIVKQTLAYVGLTQQQIRVLTRAEILASNHTIDRALLSPNAPASSRVPQQESPWYKFTGNLMRLIGVEPLKVGAQAGQLTTSDMIEHVTTLMSQGRPNPHLYTYRASLHLRAKDNAAAEQDYAEAIRLNPNFWMAYLLRGSTRYSNKDYEAAIADYTEVIRLEPKAHVAYSSRGQTYAAKQMYELSLADYDQALKMEPADFGALIGRASVYLNNRDFERAIADYDVILQRLPKNSTARHNRGTARVYVRDYEGAETDFRQVLEERPEGSRSHSNMGWLSLVRQEYDKAIEYCNAAIQLDPHNGPAYYSRGTARAAKGDINGAAADYRQALATWKNMDTKLSAPYAQEMQAFLDRTNKPSDAQG